MARQIKVITYSVVLSAGLLGCSNNAVAPAVMRATPEFAYTGNSSSALSGPQSASLSAYSVNPLTGALTQVTGSPLNFGTSLGPLIVTRDPQSRFLFAAEQDTAALHVLAITSTTGAATEVPTSPYALTGTANGIVIDSTDKFLYFADEYNNVTALSLSSSGVLTQVANGTANIGLDPPRKNKSLGFNSLHISADGHFLYFENGYLIAVYSLSSTTGAPTLIQTLSTSPAAGTGGLVFDPSGKYAYLVADSTSALQTYSIDLNSGLVALAYQSVPVVETLGFSTIVLTPNGTFAYTIENGSSLVAYAISDGAFTPIGVQMTNLGANQIAVDPTGRFLYVTQSCNTCSSSQGPQGTVMSFSIGGSGDLTPLSTTPVSTVALPYTLTLASQ